MKRKLRSNGFRIHSALSFTHNLLPPIFYHIQPYSHRPPAPEQSNIVRLLQRGEIVRNQVDPAVLIYS